MVDLTPDRAAYHDWIERFKAMLRPGCMVADIGKSHIHDYRPMFQGFDYVTIDRDAQKQPDVLMDVEQDYGLTRISIPAMMCNGVVEQCGDPYRLAAALYSMLAPGGLILWGIISVGYPVYGNDRVRFTPQGATLLVQERGFEVLDQGTVLQGNVPSYNFMICRRPDRGDHDR